MKPEYSTVNCFRAAAALVIMLGQPLAVVADQPGSGAEGTGSGLSLSGTTRHPVLAEAEVEVALGSETVTAMTDSEGRYDISVNCNNDDAVIFIYVQGSGEYDHVRASRVVDSCAALDQAAGQSGTFEVGPVSPVSTAAYAVLRWYVVDVASLSWPPDAGDMKAHRHSVAGFYAGDILQSLPSMIAGHLPLPASMNTTLDVLLDRPALLDYNDELFDQVDEEVIDTALQAVLWDPNLNLRTEVLTGLSSLAYHCSPIMFACDTSLWTVSGVDFYALGGRFGGLADVEFRALQDMVFSDTLELPEDNLRAIRMTGEDGEPLSETMSISFHPDYGQIEQRISREFADLRVLDASESLPLGSYVEKTLTTYPNDDLPDEVTLSAFPGIRSALRGDAELPEWAGPQPGESWHMPLFLGPANEVANASPFRYDRLSFEADGIGQTALSDLDFDWEMVDGALEIEGPDMNTHRYRFLGGELDRHPLFEITYRPASEEVRSVVLAAVSDNDSPGFSGLEVAGRYWGGFVSLDERMLLPFFGFPVEHLVWHLEADGTGWRASMTDPEQLEKPEDAIDLTWTMEDGRLVFERPISPPFVFHRSWSMMALHEPTQDIFVNEVGPVFSDDPDFELQNAPGRLNLFRRIDLPD